MEEPLASVALNEHSKLKDAESVRLAREAMGTRFEILVRSGAEDPAGTPAGRADLLACAEAALDEIESLHRSLSAFRRDSVLSYVNENAADAAVRIDPVLFELLATCRELHAASNGAFDPSVGALMESLGFRAEEAAGGKAMAEARARVGFDAVVLDADTFSVRFLKPGLRLDLGAIAKGFGLDEAVAILRAEGVTDALIHGGTSTVAALGSAPDAPAGAGWTIAIRDPRSGTSGAKAASQKPRLLARARLRDRALSVSAPHGRIVKNGGRVRGHLMNPRKGAPAEGVLLAAAVSRSAARADAWSTAFAAAGQERFAGLVERAGGIEAALILHGPAGEERLEIGGPHPEIFDTHSTIKE
jgi:thiamine biosynthesis lipoprotein